MRGLAWLLAVAVAAAAGCKVSVDASDLEFSCERDGKCPKGFDCIAGTCVNPADEGQETVDASAPDPADASQADADLTVAEASCDELFSNAPGYQLCQEEMDRCHFNVLLGGDTCENACAALGSACLTAYDNDQDLCAPLAEDTCQTLRETEICVCERGLVE